MACLGLQSDCLVSRLSRVDRWLNGVISTCWLHEAIVCSLFVVEYSCGRIRLLLRCVSRVEVRRNRIVSRRRLRLCDDDIHIESRTCLSTVSKLKFDSVVRLYRFLWRLIIRLSFALLCQGLVFQRPVFWIYSRLLFDWSRPVRFGIELLDCFFARSQMRLFVLVCMNGIERRH